MSNPQETGASAEDRTDKQPKKDKPKKKYEASDYFLKDTYVDCKDSVNSWCVGRILERCEGDHTIKVNFDGWSHKWDEVNPISLSNVLIYHSGSDLHHPKSLHSENIQSAIQDRANLL